MTPSNAVGSRLVKFWIGLASSALGFACAAKTTPVDHGLPRLGAPQTAARASTVSTAPVSNQGGMWLPSQIPAQATALRRLGLAIDPELLASPKSSLLGAIVHLNGCSASFVSKTGLVITNHHCATGALQHNSTPRADLLHTGMLAKTRADERTSGPSTRLAVLSKMTDISDRVRSAVAGIADDLARALELERQEKESVRECEQGRPGIRCGFVSMYRGLRYFSIETLELRDVRLVYAPAAGIGNFGGEVDNWRWPRHAGDVAIFRAYVGQDGLPADYSPSNVPYEPPAFLKLASAPLAEGDLVFVAGYPGHTSTLASAAEMQQTEEHVYPERLAMFDAYLSLIAELSKNDPALAIKATGRRRGFDNYRTKHSGELEGMRRGNFLARKREQEAELEKFIASDPGRRAKYGRVLPAIDAAFAEQERTREADSALEREFLMPRLMLAAFRIARMADERRKPDAERDPEFQERNVPKLQDDLRALSASYDATLDRALLKLALQRDRARDEAHRTPLLALIAGDTPRDADIDKAVAGLYGQTRLGNESARSTLFTTTAFESLGRSNDSLLRAFAKLYPAFTAMIERRKRFSGKLASLEPTYLEALLALRGGLLAPDANATLRLSYGAVRRAPPGEPGGDIGAFTSLSQLVSKNSGEEPFAAPKKLLDAAPGGRHSRYADAKLNDVPVDFLSDLQISNGNSGSATLNARGELVGLAFDGTYQSVASDWLSLPTTRSIHVDLRYVLFLLRYVDEAPELLAELGVHE